MKSNDIKTVSPQQALQALQALQEIQSSSEEYNKYYSSNESGFLQNAVKFFSRLVYPQQSKKALTNHIKALQEGFRASGQQENKKLAERTASKISSSELTSIRIELEAKLKANTTTALDHTPQTASRTSDKQTVSVLPYIHRKEEPTQYAEIKGFKSNTPTLNSLNNNSSERGPLTRSDESLNYIALEMHQAPHNHSDYEDIDQTELPSSNSDYEDIDQYRREHIPAKETNDNNRSVTFGITQKASITTPIEQSDSVSTEAPSTTALYAVPEKPIPLLRKAKKLLHTTADGKKSLAADKKSAFEQLLDHRLIKADHIKDSFLKEGGNTLSLDPETLSIIHKAYGKKRAFEAFQANKETARKTIEDKGYTKTVNAAALAELTRLGAPENVVKAEKNKTKIPKPQLLPKPVVQKKPILDQTNKKSITPFNSIDTERSQSAITNEKAVMESMPQERVQPTNPNDRVEKAIVDYINGDIELKDISKSLGKLTKIQKMSLQHELPTYRERYAKHSKKIESIAWAVSEALNTSNRPQSAIDPDKRRHIDPTQS